MSPTISAVSTDCLVPSVPYKNKSVRFDSEPDKSSALPKSCSYEITSQNSQESGSAVNASTGKSSPNPTPLKLSDEMQTPGTVFPGYLDGVGQAKTRIRSQYVYPILNPVDGLSQWKVLKDEGSKANAMNNDDGESLRDIDEANPVSDVGKEEYLVGQDLKVEASLSPWLRELPSNPNSDDQHNGSTIAPNFHFGRTPGDRPILGMVAAHWNDDDASHISPKWWNGNGIPNSTNKYKEVVLC